MNNINRILKEKATFRGYEITNVVDHRKTENLFNHVISIFWTDKDKILHCR